MKKLNAFTSFKLEGLETVKGGYVLGPVLTCCTMDDEGEVISCEDRMDDC